MILSARSLARLAGVHPDLVRVVKRAADMTDLPFIVIEGLRTKARQAELVAAGASKTMNSRHLTGHAVDLAATVAGQIRWDWPLYYRLAEFMKAASIEEKVPVEWGGLWREWKDGPHYQLPRAEYP